ncbi:MAG: deoxyguanosinetriphosphate triphosphohydrolase [Desulfobulbaceae bacterium]|nr:deoxyguanosinetriphosphate triphosphohydrolase [Desulfobulbaceae bacterium]HIJ77873.1 deoxyguanosinetriphosphate triphosphohydrolase [Deltaproteobacteria bacterium]
MNLSIRQQIEEREAIGLAPYATLSRNSKGRLRPEDECPIRGAFQRDRDRIIHCKSFRRLKHKTQVFLAPTGDHYRTRLTHVLEVSQIARTISVALRLNGHLTEAISLGHDLGHTPFGHAGESILNELYPHGFRHYDQSVRVVSILEKKGQGLNLTHEVLDGIAKHSKGRSEILPQDLSELPETMEGRVVRMADIIAYVNHDLDDAVRAGVISESQIPAPLQKLFGDSHSHRISAMVHDLVVQTLNNGGERLVMSPDMMEGITELRSFLYENVYESNKVHDDFIKAMKVMRELYEYFLTTDDNWERVINYNDDTPKEQMVCDFIAGMTDRYALDLYTNIFLPKPWSVM